MENSPLNKAHFHGRKADNDIKYGRFEDAINNHQKAYDYLIDARKNISSQKTIESLNLQCRYHLTQKQLIQMKFVLYQKYKTILEQNKQIDAEFIEKSKNGYFENSSQLQLAIYNSIEETQTLLNQLAKGNNLSIVTNTTTTTTTTTALNNNIINNNKKLIAATGNNNMEESKIIVTMDNKNDIVKMGIKSQKDDKIIVEELKTLNQQLNLLLYQLLTQLDKCHQENNDLRDKINILQNGSPQQQQQPLVTTDTPTKNESNSITTNVVSPELSNNNQLNDFNEKFNQLQILTDSTEEGGPSSRYTYSSCDELSPETAEARDLPPLELPKFDLTFVNKNDDDE